MNSKYMEVDKNQEIEKLKKNITPFMFFFLHVSQYIAPHINEINSKPYNVLFLALDIGDNQT